MFSVVRTKIRKGLKIQASKYMRKNNESFMLFVTKALLFVFVFMIVSCSGNKESEHALESSAVNKRLIKGEDFTTFIDRFHSDSVFAVSRISESVTGINTEAEKYDSIADKYSYDYVWSLEEIKDDLYWFKEMREDDEYKCVKTVKDDNAEELIYMPDSCIRVLLRFSLKDGKWYLCGYDMNMI